MSGAAVVADSGPIIHLSRQNVWISADVARRALQEAGEPEMDVEGCPR